MKEMKDIPGPPGRLPGGLFHPVLQARRPERSRGSIPHGPGIRQASRHFLPRPGLLYRRGHLRLRPQGIGHHVTWGREANKFLSYGVASVSGAILAVCSCTVLPLFAGIYTHGAGIGPATAFLYSGPAINVLAITMTAKVLGWQIGLARLLGAVGFSVIIGLLMQLIFPKHDERDPQRLRDSRPEGDGAEERPLWKTALHIGAMVGILVFMNWAKSDPSVKAWYFVYQDRNGS